MLFHRHVPIISYYIDIAFFNLPGWKIPTTGITDMRFFHRSRIDKEFSITEFDLLTLEGNHSLEKHHSVPGKTDSHDIKPFQIRDEIMQPKTEINTSIVIGRFHAVPFDQKRRADMTEEEIGRESNKKNPDQESWGQGRKKELADSLAHAKL